MAKMRHCALALLVALLFSACATTTLPPPEPIKLSDDELKLVLIKSKNIRFYDFGTLSVSGANVSNVANVANVADSANPSDSNTSNPSTSQSPSDLRIELRVFKLGKFLGSFVVTKSEICYTDFDKIDDCAPKWVAARSFFGSVSYGELFEDIFLKKDIFDGQGKRVGTNGVEIQEFSYGGEKFYYERSQKRIYFKNLSNGVIVSIEDYVK